MSAPELIASRYRIVRELGRGGMGVVYVVEHLRTGDQVALKLLRGRAATDPKSIERFQREARASARIKSQHVVKVLDADVAPELDNAPFLVMELLDGSDLEQLVEGQGRLPPERVLGYMSQIARALDKSHRVGIVHRDLKPENVFVHHREDGSEMVKILDFGISKIVATDDGDTAGVGITGTGAIMGTPLYMAPEQARGYVSEIGPPTDVWAIGLISLYLLTGENYWTGNTVADLLVQILTKPMDAPSQRWPFLPQALDEWFARSCARAPAERFGSVGEQVAALSVALGVDLPAGHSLSASSSSSSYDAPAAVSPVERHAGRTPVLIAVIALLAGAGGATVFVLHSRNESGAATAAGIADAPAVAAASASAPVAATSGAPRAGAPAPARAPAPAKDEAGAPNAARSAHVADHRASAASPAKPRAAPHPPARTTHTAAHAAKPAHSAKAFEPSAP